jgi:hypothetical protein
MVLVINTVEQALRLGLISQATIDKYGEDKVKAFIEADANQYVESQIVAENENDFRRAARVLTDVISNNQDTISISTTKHSENISSDRIVVEQMKDLYFISYNTYSQEDYTLMYDAVAVLFSLLEIEGIAVTDDEIYFCISSYYGIVSDIIYRSDDEQPSVLHTVKEQEKINDGWYIVISHD